MSDASHTFESYYKRATSPLVVLCLLRDGAMYGYQISQEMDVRSNGRFTIAVLYPILYRLEEQGYIRVEQTEIVKNRARSYYAITEEGRVYLEQSIQTYQELHDAFEKILNHHRRIFYRLQGANMN